MPVTYIIGVLLLLQAAGCAIISPAPEPAAAQGGTVVVEQLAPATPDQLPRSIDTPGGTLIIERLPPLPEVVPPLPVASPTPPIPPVTASVTPPVSASVPSPVIKPVTAPPAVVPPAAAVTAPAATVAVPDKTAAKPPVKAAAAAVRAAPKPGASARVAASTLDLDALEQRLKDTDAIGVFTKIALKNQVDDLLKRFKAYHESDGKTALTQLRQSYDQLLAKVNDVLKNGDPSLAGEIMGSREAIWGLLSDPVKFAKL